MFILHRETYKPCRNFKSVCNVLIFAEYFGLAGAVEAEFFEGSHGVGGSSPPRFSTGSSVGRAYVKKGRFVCRPVILNKIKG